MKKLIFYCEGCWSGNPIDGEDFGCDAECAGDVDCEYCLYCGGLLNPNTGKKDYIRYFLLRTGLMTPVKRYPRQLESLIQAYRKG